MKRRKNGQILMLIGLLLILAALVLALLNIQADRSASKSAVSALERLSPVIDKTAEKARVSNDRPPLPDYIRNPGMDMPVEEIDGINYIGFLELPALNLSLPVIENWSYPLLKLAPCRYSGSAYLGNMVVAAHSYKSHFGLLKDMNSGDEVIFTDSEGNRFFYTVAELIILKPFQVEEMTESGYELSLFSCTYDSSARVTLRCSLEKTVPASSELT